MTLWSGRFTSPMDETLWDLSESYSFDHVLYAHDIEGSKAHVRGLVTAGLLSSDEATTLLATLDAIREEFDRGAFERAASDEDIHMAIERRATELAGDVGAKLHTARSRNDQVATTLRLFTRDALRDIALATLELIGVLQELAARSPGAHLPGYTHLQRAQPVLLSHHLNAHAFALLRDVDRLGDARRRLNVSPLGAGAIAGTSLNIDPVATADLLGFDRAFANSMDAVSDRDFVAEALFDVALLGVHLSRMGEELVLWTSAEFNFATLGDDFTTGSSMLPHKKNSDVAELARGKSGRLIGNLTGLLVVLKGLPLVVQPGPPGRQRAVVRLDSSGSPGATSPDGRVRFARVSRGSRGRGGGRRTVGGHRYRRRTGERGRALSPSPRAGWPVGRRVDRHGHVAARSRHFGSVDGAFRRALRERRGTAASDVARSRRVLTPAQNSQRC